MDRRAPIRTDAVVVGAGPVGLFQIFELGLLGIQAHLIDSLAEAGGQCMALYADKPIYDIPGTPACTARELVERLRRQIEPFATPLHLGQQVDRVERRSDGRFDVDTSAGTRFDAATIFIAGGVGSFQPRRLKVDGLSAFEGRGLFHQFDDAAAFAGKRVVVVGDGDAALDAAAQLARPGPNAAATVTLMHRRDEFKAEAATLEQVRVLRAQQRIAFVAAQATGFGQAQGRLRALHVTTADGSARELPLDALLVLLGVSPKLGPIAHWGLALQRKQLVVDTEKFETSEPGIFAVGDINTYPGKKKLILCGFHEATLAAYGAARIVFPGEAAPLEYTTTSTRLHRLLRVAPPAGS